VTVLLLLALVVGLVGGTVAAAPRDRDGERNDRQGDRGAETAQPAEEQPAEGPDPDGDYFPTAIDNCPDVPNADQSDGDGDGVGDACQRAADRAANAEAFESDVDGDGVPDRRDNCPEVQNGGQGDADGDGLGNQCDGTPNGEAPPVSEPDPAPAEAPAPERERGDAPAADEAAPAETDGGGGGGGGDGGRDREERADEAAEPPVEGGADNGGAGDGGGDGGGNNRDRARDAGDSGDAAPTTGDGEAPAPEAAPRPPAGPPPALEPFVVPDDAWRPVVRIDAGDVPARERARPRQREGEDRGERRSAAGGGGEEAGRDRRPARDDRGEEAGGDGSKPTGDSFLDREESMLGGADGGTDGDPLDGEAVDREPAPEPDQARQRDRDSAAGTDNDRAADPGDGEPAAETRRGWSAAGIALQAGPGGGSAPAEEPIGVEIAPPPDDGGRGGERREREREQERPVDWQPDEHFTGGAAERGEAGTRILGTQNDALYLTQRVGQGDDGFSYRIPVPADGTYLVRLHFAELDPDADDGDRVVNVAAEGRTRLKNYDVAADVGARTAVVKEFEVAVDDGRLDLGFAAARGAPAVAGIEVLAEPDGERWVDVDLSSRTVRLMVGDAAIAAYRASVSEGPRDDFQDTMPGSFEIEHKIAELTWTPYAQNYFMYWASFDPARENGFHSWVMDHRGRVVPNGDGPTWGCVATAPEDAAAIYNFVEIGTRVEIHD